MMREIRALQNATHLAALRVVAKVDRAALTGVTRGVEGAEGDGARAEAMGRAYNEHAASTLAALWSLSDALMFKYADGYINEVQTDGSVRVTAEPYADWWLKAVGYEKGPPPVPPSASKLVWV